MGTWTPWPPEDEARLRELCAGQPTTADAIGAELGRHRNSIIGKCNRLGIKWTPMAALSGAAMGKSGDKRVSKARPKPAAKAARKTKPAPAPAIKRVVPRVPDPPAPVDILGLTPRTCRFPLWPDTGAGGRLYCGETTMIGSSWCSYHWRICYREDARPVMPKSAAVLP